MSIFERYQLGILLIIFSENVQSLHRKRHNKHITAHKICHNVTQSTHLKTNPRYDRVKLLSKKLIATNA